MRENLNQYLEKYKNIPLFSGMSEADLLSMLDYLGAYIKSYHKDEFIVLYEAYIKCVGVVLEGNVLMIKEDLWGNKTVLVTIKQSELFGEAFACGSTGKATVAYTAGTSVKVLFLPFEKVMHSCTKSCVYHHRLIENMVTLIANKNVQLMEKVEITTKMTLREKIFAFLSIQAQKKNSKYFTIDMGRIEMAEYLCADRSALTRELKRMKAEGILDFDKNTFRILKILGEKQK